MASLDEILAQGELGKPAPLAQPKSLADRLGNGQQGAGTWAGTIGFNEAVGQSMKDEAEYDAQKAASAVQQKAVQEAVRQASILYKQGKSRDAIAVLAPFMPKTMLQQAGKDEDSTRNIAEAQAKPESQFFQDPDTGAIKGVTGSAANGFKGSVYIPGIAGGSAKPGKPSEFEKELQKKNADAFASLQDSELSVDNQLDTIENATKSFTDFTQKSKLGTGPVGSLFGLSKYLDKDAQKLDSQFKKINLDTMTTLFKGMSKAIDSDAERRAFEATGPDIKNDDNVNASILLGIKALSLKKKAEIAAQKEFVSENKNLDNYVSPVIGKTVAVVSPSGDMKLIPRGAEKEAKKMGYMDLDTYSQKHILKKEGKAPAAAASAQQSVRMQAPDGSIRLIPASQVDAAVKAGGKVVN